MKIYIPSHKRPDKQITWESLPDFLKKKAKIVVQASQAEDYEQYNPLVLPKHIKSIGPTRQYLMENVKDKYLCMMDDDLRFYTRILRGANKGKLRKMEDKDFQLMYDTLEGYLSSGYIHAGISAREGNNRVEGLTVENTRMMRVLCYSRGRFNRLGIRFDRMEDKEDFDVTLQLLEKGFPNIVSFQFAHNQTGSQTSGGCSDMRTLESMAKSSKKLAKLHPGFVKVVEKETKSAWGGGVRTDVRISWKKAYESSTR